MRVVIILVVALVVTGCTSGGSSPGVQVEGVEWRAVTIAGLQPSPRHVPTLRLAGSRVEGSGGCNMYSGGARFDGGRLVIDGLAMTAMACLDDVANERERQFIEILGSRPLIGTRGGQLVLSGTSGEIVLAAS
jgi:heat shock protein HslJ